MTSLAKRYITLNQTAELSTIAVATLYEWVARRRIGKAQGVHKVGRRLLVDWDVFRAKVIESGDF